MPDTSTFLISIPDKSIGFAPGDPVAFHLHVSGFTPQTVRVRFLINDTLGATRFSARDEERRIEPGHPILSFSWTVDPDAPPGPYLVTTQVFSEAENRREIATETFAVVHPGRCGPDGFPAAFRDRLAEPRHPFEPVAVDRLEACFHTAHTACQLSHNPDGSWGGREDGTPLEYRTPGNLTLGYLYAWEALGRDEYADQARAGLAYLRAQQEPSGAYRWWRAGYPEGVLNERDSFYDTGWAGLALAEGYRIFGDPRDLDAVRKAADWTLTCPFTGNNNYDAFSLWFLSLLYQFTGERKYLDSAVWRTEGGIFFAQLPRGGWPGHNFHIGYQSILVNGLASLYDVLPEDHPFTARLRRRLCMALNFALALQTSNGDFCQGWEYDRDFRIDDTGEPVGATVPARSELIRAFYKVRDRLDVAPATFHGLCQSVVRRIQPLETLPPEQKKNALSLMDIGVLLKWAKAL